MPGVTRVREREITTRGESRRARWRGARHGETQREGGDARRTRRREATYVVGGPDGRVDDHAHEELWQAALKVKRS